MQFWCDDGACPGCAGCATGSGFASADLPAGGSIAGRHGTQPEALIVPATGPKAAASTAPPHRIDVHHHLVPPAYVQALHPRIPLLGPLTGWSPQMSLDDMDRSGVATAILSLTTPGLWFNNVPETRQLARACNEYGAGLMQQHKGRFGLFAAMPLPDIDGTLAEIAYAMDTLGADGVGLFTSYDDKWLGDPHFAPVFAELNRRKAVVYTHPTSNQCCANLISFVTDATIEYGTDTTRTIASLVFSGAAAKYPDIKMIFSHAGGTMPFLIERFVLLSRTAWGKTHVPDGVLPLLRRFFYDTAQAANPVALGGLLQIVPISQLMFGTDVPYRTCLDHVTGLAGCGFTPEEMRAIDRDNALRLLPRWG